MYFIFEFDILRQIRNNIVVVVYQTSITKSAVDDVKMIIWLFLSFCFYFTFAFSSPLYLVFRL